MKEKIADICSLLSCGMSEDIKKQGYELIGLLEYVNWLESNFWYNVEREVEI